MILINNDTICILNKMTEIRFYHLTKKSLEQALPDLLGKALENGKKIVVKLPEESQVKPMSNHLWVCRRNGFFAHGIKGDGNEEMCPIWLTAADNDNPNTADMLVLTDGATEPDTEKYSLVCEMFNGQDDAQVTSARTRWKAYKEAGHTLTYFQQTDKGGWEKKG